VRLKQRHHLRRAISFNGSLECTRGRRRLPHRRSNSLASAQQHDEPPVKISAATCIGIFASDRSTF
jgi:hypothetical protein